MRRLRQVRLGTWTAATAVTGGVCCAVTLGLLASSIRQLHDAGALSARTEQTVALANAVEENSIAIASNERGFIATKSPAFLSAFDARVASHNSGLDRLKGRLGPSELPRFQAVRAAADRLVYGWAALQMAFARRDPAGARRSEATGVGLTRAAAVGEQTRLLVRDEQAIAAAARSSASSSAYQAKAIAIAGFSALVVIAFTYVGLLLLFVTQPIRRLRSAMGEVARGNLMARVPAKSIAEVVEVERGFNAMADAILEQQAAAGRANADLEARRLDVEHAVRALAAEKGTAETMYELAALLAAQTGLVPIAQVVADRIGHAAGADAVTVYGLNELCDRRLHLLAAHAADTTSLAAEIALDEDGGPSIMPALIERGTSHRELHLQLTQGSQTLGVVTLARLGDEPFSEREQELVRHMAEQSALALGTALSHARAARLLSLNETLIESSRDGIRLVGLDGTILAQNSRMTTLLARATAAQPAGSFWEQAAEIGPRTTDPETFAAMTEQLRTQPDLEALYEYELADSGIVFSRLVAPVRDSAGKQTGRIIVLRDVTVERQAQRMKDEFVASVSHELRTPLTSISGYVELLLNEETGELNTEQQHFLEVVDRNSDRLLGLVNDLLFVGRLESGMLELDPGPTNVAEILADAAEAVRPAAESQQVSLDLSVGPLPQLVADRSRLSQLVDNLLSNAVKFTPPGGNVFVTAARDARKLTLCVADTGIGVPRSEQARLFDRFFRASTAIELSVPGTGLGLAITKAIAEAHGGTISVEDTPGGGTTFRVELPLAESRAAVAA